jgi:HNH endonuclease
MSSIPARLRRMVIHRAEDRCEYCLLAQVGQEATFHIDHIIPESHGGETDEDNLALACVSCSLRKEARQTGIDSQTNKRVPLFHPRRDIWNEHFRWDGVEVVGITPKGRATVNVLKMNRPSIIGIRHEEVLRGRHLA